MMMAGWDGAAGSGHSQSLNWTDYFDQRPTSLYTKSPPLCFPVKEPTWYVTPPLGDFPTLKWEFLQGVGFVYNKCQHKLTIIIFWSENVYILERFK